MLEELQPLSLTDAARQLGVDPFEVVRLLVAGEKIGDGPLAVDPAAIDELRELGRIDTSWWESVDLPDDADPRRQRIRAAMQLMLSRKHVGDEAATRMDNVWRGLPVDDQQLLQQALAVLAEDGLVRIVASRVGLMICIAPGAEKKVQGLVDGKQVPSGLSAMLDG